MKNENQVIDSDEIRLKDIVVFFRRNLLLIVIFGVAGLLFSITYFVQKPEKYEAIWQMKMAIGSEEPAALIQRLRWPTTYPVEVQQSCGMPENREFGDYLGGALKADTIKGLANAVEMKVRASSPDQARRCAEAVAALIVVQQHDLILDRLAGRDDLLGMLQQTLQKELLLYGGLNKYEVGSLKYIAKLERISTLNTRIDSLKEELLMSQKHPAKLIAPMYVTSQPVSRKVVLVMLLGVVLGLMLGVLLALGREGWRRAA